MFTLAQFEALAAQVLLPWYGGQNQPALPKIDPGPYGNPETLDYPGSQIIYSAGPGPGFIWEAAYDQPMLSVYSIGEQNDYRSGEDLASRLDQGLCSIVAPFILLDVRVMPIMRAGGGPTLVQMDESSRWHFMCSYIAQVDSGI